MRRIEAVEKDLKALAQSSASKDDLSRVRAELKKVYDGLHIGAYAILNCLLSSFSHPIQNFWTFDRTYGACVSRRFNGKGLYQRLCLTEQDLHALAKKEATSIRV